MIDHLRLPAVRSRAAAFAPPLALAMLVSLVACEDSQSAAQRQLAEKVEQTIAASEKALPGGRIPDTTEAALAAAGQLRSLAQSLASTQGGTPAQRSAAMQLAAGLARKAAEIDLTIAVDLEAQHRLERLAVSRAAAAAAGLEALAGPLDRIDFASSRTQLKSQKEMAEGQLRQLQTQVRTLESAVAQVDRQLSETEAEAARIDLEAEQLRAQA
ncbi:MAG: hypothetical protein FJ253_11590, partial [Phycisphaerae bacterium]|nr:hypothetical protein [Phycisphaerae bacterium]